MSDRSWAPDGRKDTEKAEFIKIQMKYMEASADNKSVAVSYDNTVEVSAGASVGNEMLRLAWKSQRKRVRLPLLARV